MNAEEKWKNYHSNLYDEEQVYVLLYEDGQKALFLPGGKEVFCLKKYQEELGKDYNRITLYLCTVTDYNISIGKDEVHVHDSDSNDEMGPPPSKFARLSNGSSSYIDIDKTYDDDGNTSCILQLKHDEELAKELEKQLNKPVDVAICKPDDECKDPSSVVKALEKRVDHSEQLSLVIRRGAPLTRVLSLWKREVSKKSPEKKLVVQYHGEEGVDNGAIAKEFLSEITKDIRRTMFPDGSPINSTYHVQNGNFKACGQIIAVSLAQGGQPPCFIDESVYDLLIDPDVDLKELDQEKYLTAKEKEMINSIKEDVSSHHEVIIDHGFTGVINQENIDEIVKSVVVCLVTRKNVFLKEFMAGLQLYGLASIIIHNPKACKSLLVQQDLQEAVTANDVFAMIQPEYSPLGTSRRNIEEKLIDFLQDFLFHLEDDSNIAGYQSALAWNYDDGEGDDLYCDMPNEKFEMAELTPAGVMQWLTGQNHKPLNGEILKVIAHFDHDCLSQNPKTQNLLSSSGSLFS
ncbi:hypothetical protein QZH41_004789 [Actinostola sp. cb2023]|nr:hypothetical protein QZH41_004789 [Actinostola sp. cb2023]